jgi:hypothetical protein
MSHLYDADVEENHINLQIANFKKMYSIIEEY